jgi:hypothetical protein
MLLELVRCAPAAAAAATAAVTAAAFTATAVRLKKQMLKPG